MNFLSGLKSAASKGLSSIGATLNNFGSNFLGALSGKKYSTAQALTALNYDNPANNALQEGKKLNYTPYPNMTVMPDPSRGEKGGPGYNGISTNNNLYFNEGRNQAVSQATSNIRPSTAPKKTSTQAERTDSAGRVSTKEQGNPYYANGKLIVPETAFSGLSGSGGSGMQTTAPMVGATGTSGSGARGFGGVGQGSTGLTYNQQSSDEEKRKKDGTQTINTKQDPTGATLAAMAAQSNPDPMDAPQVPDLIDAGFISGVQQKLSQTIGSNMSEKDKQTVYAQLQNNLLSAKAKLDQQTAMPDEPVIDTQEQLAFLEQSEDPFGVKQAIDQFRQEQTNLSELQTTKVELMKSVQALNEAYRPIIKEIKDNPNMPKALARRKIEALAVTQKETLQGFLDQLTIVNQQVDDQNEMVNRAFQIVTLSENRADKAQDNIRQQLKMFLDTGAIAGFTDVEIKTFAQAANMPEAALRKAKEAALTEKAEITTNEFADGSLRGIDKNTGKVVWSIPGGAKASGDGGTTQNTETFNGQKVRVVYDKQGNVVSQTVLGSSGENTKSDFISYIASEAGTKSSDELKTEADRAGVPIDKDVQAAIDRNKKKGGIRNFFANIF